MANALLGLQAAIANGSEPSFDGQPMQVGIHLRWSFLPELGFPPGGFWLCRRVAQKGERRIAPPSHVTTATTQTTPSEVAALPGADRWQATMPAPCQSVTLAGRAGKNCREIIVETFGRRDGKLVVTSRRVIPIEGDCFRVTVMAAEISCVRVAGAGSVDECGGTVEPPRGCGESGEEPGEPGGTPPAGTGPPGWGKPGRDGWQCWTVPFTLPVTHQHWPPRYYKAPDPLTASPTLVAQHDVDEAIRRLGALQLVAGLTAAQQKTELFDLQRSLVRLVRSFSGTLLPDVPIETPAADSGAPQLAISIMQQLLVLALDPYFARVLGIYFVDTDIQPGVEYDYCVTGYWGPTPCQVMALYPGLAPGAPLARGKAVFAGMKIAAGGDATLWRWLRDNVNGSYQPKPDPGAPPGVAAAMASAVGAMASTAQPKAMLAACSFGQGFLYPPKTPSLQIGLPRGAMRADLRVSGQGSVSGLAAGVTVATMTFNSTQLSSVTLTAPNFDTLIDTVVVTGHPSISLNANVVIVGDLHLHPLAPDAIGTRYALMHAPKPLSPLAAPANPIATFRHRKADVDPATLDLVPHSLFEVEWPAPASKTITGNPVTDPIHLPPPSYPVAFVAEREDPGKANSRLRLAKRIMTASQPKPTWSKVASARIYRFSDAKLRDPIKGWSYRVAAFDMFGALGKWSGWSAAIGVEKIAAAPTALRITQFDNSAASGGAAAANGSSWNGGTLKATASWSGAAFLMYPDVRTARALVEQVNVKTGVFISTLATKDFVLPVRKAEALSVDSVILAAQPDGTQEVAIKTIPPLPEIKPGDPAAVLMLTFPDGAQENFVVRPNANHAAVLKVGANARVVTAHAQLAGQPGYFVAGWSKTLTFSVPLHIAVNETTARGQISVSGSTQDPFDANEQIVDPNGGPSRPEPRSVVQKFTGPQRLIPPTPPTPVHEVHHVYYDPADFSGRAGKTLPFVAAPGTGISGYFLMRAPMQSLMLADIKRRDSLANAADQNPKVEDAPGVLRADLQSWMQTELPKWLTAFNQRAGKSLTLSNALKNADAQRSFINHFYGGLLDDELRALANMAENRMAFGRANSTPLGPGAAVFDAVDGTGFGRNVYTLAAVNNSGSQSGVTGSIGPYYTRIVTPPRPPVLYKLQPTQQAIVVAWALDANPDVAGYFVYRGTSVDVLKDLRFFGNDRAHPSPPASLAHITYTPTVAPCLAYGSGLKDNRIVGLVPDPRLFARDHEGSDMGEVALPAGPAPDVIHGVYRLDEFDATDPPLNQLKAFNYWTPPAVGGIAQIISDSPTRARLTGLRIGLGRGVPVVVVATWQGQLKVLGQVPVRRAGFIDGAFADGSPMDANAIATAGPPSATDLNAYAVVAVDIFGNISKPSTIFATQMLAKASGS